MNKYEILYGEKMDRRQRKTREAIFKAFGDLLAKKNYNDVTVGEIIERADVGRATFYSHFETKDHLLSELCAELFCHIFDSLENKNNEHRHIFECDAPQSVFLHLFRHIQKNDNGLLRLMSCENNELFLSYFKANLKRLIEKQLHVFNEKRPPEVDGSLWIHHICSTFTETLRWWLDNGKRETPETLAAYFEALI